MQTIKQIYYSLLENADYYSILILMFLAIFTLVHCHRHHYPKASGQHKGAS